jgi:hypothetical protein
MANLKDDLQDIANHGADAGYSGITYYRDTVHLYERFEDEIFEALTDDTEQFGADNVPAFIATFRRADDCDSPTGFKNLLVWYYVERVAREEDR